MQREPRDIALAQVIGFGPASLGILIAADRHGCLDHLMRKGMVYLERERSIHELKDRIFGYNIRSNSQANEFLDPIGQGGYFASLLERPEIQAISQFGIRSIALRRISVFMSGLIDMAVEKLVSVPSSSIEFGATVNTIHRGQDGSFTSYDSNNIPIARSKKLIVASGATETEAFHLLKHCIGDVNGEIVSSGDVLMGKYDRTLEQVIADKRAVLVIGNSHSAYSVASLIIEQYGDVLMERQLKVCGRGDPLLYYSSTGAANRAGYRYTWDQVYPMTNEINKFNGLRGDAKDVYLETVNGRISAVERVKISDDEMLGALAREAGLIVTATGYSPRRICVQDERVGKFSVGGNKQGNVDEFCRLRNDANEMMPNAYATGIGWSRRAYTGEHLVGMNFFHGEDADIILKQLMVID